MKLADLGVTITWELLTEPAAITAAIEAGTRGERDGTAAGLAALPPKRASDKRKATAQRRAREARRP